LSALGVLAVGIALWISIVMTIWLCRHPSKITCKGAPEGAPLAPQAQTPLQVIFLGEPLTFSL